MSNAFPNIQISSTPEITIVVHYQQEVSTPTNTKLTNDQALSRIAEFLERTTDFLRKRRLSLG